MASPKQHPDEKLRTPSAPRTSDSRWAIWWFGAHVEVGYIRLSGVKASDGKARSLHLATGKDRLDATLTSPEGVQTVTADTASPDTVAREFETEWKALFSGPVHHGKPPEKEKEKAKADKKKVAGSRKKKTHRKAGQGAPKGKDDRGRKSAREERRGATNSLGDLAPELFEQLKKK